jgi:hypothetical protein
MEVPKKFSLRGETQKEKEKRCDELWGLCIFTRAGFKSELSGVPRNPQEGIYLDPHHIAKKPCYSLRYSLENGICLTKGEHKYDAHGPDPERFREKIKRLRGKDIFEKLHIIRWTQSANIETIEMYLRNELKKLEGRHVNVGAQGVPEKSNRQGTEETDSIDQGGEGVHHGRGKEKSD